MWPQIYVTTTVNKAVLPLNKGHLCNVVIISWQQGGLIREGLLYRQQLSHRSQTYFSGTSTKASSPFRHHCKLYTMIVHGINISLVTRASFHHQICQHCCSKQLDGRNGRFFLNIQTQKLWRTFNLGFISPGDDITTCPWNLNAGRDIPGTCNHHITMYNT